MMLSKFKHVAVANFQPGRLCAILAGVSAVECSPLENLAAIDFSAEQVFAEISKHSCLVVLWTSSSTQAGNSRSRSQPCFAFCEEGPAMYRFLLAKNR